VPIDAAGRGRVGDWVCSRVRPPWSGPAAPATVGGTNGTNGGTTADQHVAITPGASSSST